jgi:hypothetical protein
MVMIFLLIMIVANLIKVVVMKILVIMLMIVVESFTFMVTFVLVVTDECQFLECSLQ